MTGLNGQKQNSSCPVESGKIQEKDDKSPKTYVSLNSLNRKREEFHQFYLMNSYTLFFLMSIPKAVDSYLFHF